MAEVNVNADVEVLEADNFLQENREDEILEASASAVDGFQKFDPNDIQVDNNNGA